MTNFEKWATEFGKNKIDNYSIYKNLPLTMFVCKNTDNCIDCVLRQNHYCVTSNAENWLKSSVDKQTKM